MGNSNIRSFAKYLKQTFVILTGDVKPGFAVPMTNTDLLTSVKSFNRSHLPIFSDNKNRGLPRGGGKFSISSLKLLLHQLMCSLQFYFKGIFIYPHGLL